MIECTPGSDRVYDGDTATTIRTGDGDDYIWITGGYDVVDAGAGTADTLKININDPETLLVESTDEATIRFSDGSGGMLGEVSNVEYFEFYDGSDEFLYQYSWDELWNDDPTGTASASPR